VKVGLLYEGTLGVPKLLEKALSEYEKILLFSADRPEYQLSLAMLYQAQSQPKKAEEAYKEALRLQPKYIPSYVNYSDFLKKQGRDKEVLPLLQSALKEVGDSAILYHTIGLWYIRNKQKDLAYPALKKAMELDSEDVRFGYVYAVAIGEEQPKEAIKILEKLYAKHTGDMQAISGLAYYYEKIGEKEKSELYRKKAQELQNFSLQ